MKRFLFLTRLSTLGMTSGSNLGVFIVAKRLHKHRGYTLYRVLGKGLLIKCEIKKGLHRVPHGLTYGVTYRVFQGVRILIGHERVISVFFSVG